MKSVRVKFQILTIMLVVIIFGYVFNYFYTSRVLSGRTYSLVYNWGQPEENSVYTSCNVSKQWTEQEVYIGAEYDFVLYNMTSTNISTWSMDMELPADVHPITDDSIWNVKYNQIGKKLHLEPMDFTSHVKAGTNRTFGMVLITDEIWQPGPITINYKITCSAIEQPLFTILTLLAFAWCLFLVQNISEFFVLRKSRAKEIKDKEIILQSMSTFINFIDAKDPYTKGHSQRVAAVAQELGRRMGLDDIQTEHLYYAGILHDAGKIGVPDNILKKVGILTADEYSIIKQHASIGGLMLAGFTSIDGIREAALYHHERYDGKGYPEGRSGKDIPLFGRIVCVADTFDAMARDRCYRKHLDREKILSELVDNSGTQFDPAIATFMIEMINDGTADRITQGL